MKDFDKALKLLKEGKLNKGKDILEKLHQENPKNTAVMYNLGMCYSELGELDKSIKMIEKCLQLDPLNVNANTALGVSYSRKGINDKAENKLRVALEMEPDNFYALKNLGAVLANQGKYDEAIKFFRRAIDIDPESPEVLYGLALALNENENTEEAEKLLRKIVEKNTNEQITELARRELSKIAMDTYKSKGLRMDAVMYMVSAMKKYKSMSKDEVKRITFEIGMVGRKGLDINDPEKKYELNSMKGKFSGIELLCYMYVGFKIIDQNVNIGADLDSEYEAALNLYGRMDQ